MVFHLLQVDRPRPCTARGAEERRVTAGVGHNLGKHHVDNLPTFFNTIMLTIWQLDRANWTKLILVQWTPLFNSHRWMLFYCINVDRTDEKKVCANFVNDANGIPSEKQTLPFVWVLHRWEPLKWFHVWEIYIFKMDFNCANWLDVGGVYIQFILNVRENPNS